MSLLDLRLLQEALECYLPTVAGLLRVLQRVTAAQSAAAGVDSLSSTERRSCRCCCPLLLWQTSSLLTTALHATETLEAIADAVTRFLDSDYWVLKLACQSVASNTEMPSDRVPKRLLREMQRFENRQHS